MLSTSFSNAGFLTFLVGISILFSNQISGSFFKEGRSNVRIEKTVKVPELQRQERSIWKLGRTSKMTSITQSSSSLQQTTSQNSNNQLTDFPKRRQRTFRDMMSSVSSLFTVKDKSIGEFLREYQVRIFYDIILSGLTWVFLSFLAKIIP